MNASIHPLPSAATATAVAASTVMYSPPLAHQPEEIVAAEPAVAEEPMLAAPVTLTCSAFLERAPLDRAISFLVRVAERRTTIPVLACAFLKAVDGGVLIETTDLDVTMRAIVPGRADADFKTAIPVHKLAELLKKVDAKCDVKIDVTRTTEEYVCRDWNSERSKQVDTVKERVTERATLALGALRVTLEGENPADWPADFDFLPPAHSFVLSTADALRGFGRTEMAISTEETRYYLNGTYVHVTAGKNSRLRFVATDGHRLCQVDMDTPAGASAAMPGMIVPRKAVGELVRLLKAKGTPDAIVVNVCSRHMKEGKPKSISPRLLVQSGDLTVISKTIDGTFPDYQRVIPLGNDKRMRAELKDLIDAVKQVTVVQSERGRGVKLSLSDGFLNLSVCNPDLGSATFRLEVDYSGEPLDIGFNSQSLLHILSEFECGVVELMLADPGSPTIFRGEDEADSGVLYVLMPMRV